MGFQMCPSNHQMPSRLAVAVIVSILGCDSRSPYESFSYTSENPVVSDQRPPVIVDPERRMERLGDHAEDPTVDVSAFTGMPAAYQAKAKDYLQAVIAELDTKPLTRIHYYSTHSRKPYSGNPVFPDIAEAVFDRDMLVPLTLFPRPQAVMLWAESQQAQTLGWTSMTQGLENRSYVYGSTVIFEEGTLSEEPRGLPASPLGTEIPIPIDYGPIQSSNLSFFLLTGKLLRLPSFEDGIRPTDVAMSLKLGLKDGATKFAEIKSVPPYLLNTRLRWVQTVVGATTKRFLAYSLVDGAGAIRDEAGVNCVKYAGGWVSPFMRPLSCARYQPRALHHDLLLIPTPIEWPVRVADLGLLAVHEEWCFDGWFPAQAEACWVIREAENSKPLQESFLLMPAEEPSDRPVFFAAVFIETEPERLVKELAALHRVSPKEVLESTEKMAHLKELYDRLKSFDLSQ